MFESTSLIQSAWVVSDLNRSIMAWVAKRVGPFVTFDIQAPDSLYRGAASPLQMSIAIAQAGAMQVELIQQTSSGPSAYRDVVAEGECGFHHVLKVSKDYDADVAELRSQGICMATEGKVGGARWVYADTRKELGCMLEICPDTEFLRTLFQKTAEAAAGWDGITSPIRPLSFTGIYNSLGGRGMS